MFCTSARLQCSLRLSLSAADPHTSGRTASVFRCAHTATLTGDYHRRFCRVCFVLSVDYRPSCFGSDNRLRSLHAHRIALLALISLARWLSTHSLTQFTQHSFLNGKCFVMFVRCKYAVAKSSDLSPVTFLTHSAIAVPRSH